MAGPRQTLNPGSGEVRSGREDLVTDQVGPKMSRSVTDQPPALANLGERAWVIVTFCDVPQSTGDFMEKLGAYAPDILSSQPSRSAIARWCAPNDPSRPAQPSESSLCADQGRGRSQGPPCGQGFGEGLTIGRLARKKTDIRSGWLLLRRSRRRECPDTSRSAPRGRPSRHRCLRSTPPGKGARRRTGQCPGFVGIVWKTDLVTPQASGDHPSPDAVSFRNQDGLQRFAQTSFGDGR